MSFLDSNVSGRVTQAYRTLGLVPITSQYHSGARTFTKHRRNIAIKDEKLALAQEQAVEDPRLNPEETFSFTDLPAEIRVRVYEYALVRTRRLHFEILRTPNLACVCKQLRQESLPVFLRVNQFQASYSRGLDGSYGLAFADETLAWLRTLPLTTNLIRDIRVTFQGDLGQGEEHKSIVFQIIATGKEMFVNHFNRRCPFCTEGCFGTYYHLPHPNYDHPCLKSNPLKLKSMHDDFVRAVQSAYFTSGNANWGKGGLSMTEVVDLAKAADKIKEDPEVFMRFCFCVEMVVNHADKIGQWATVYSRLLERQRVQEQEAEGDGQHVDQVEQWSFDDV